MRESLRRIIPLAAFILIFSCLPAASAAQGDQEVRQAILQLAQGNVQTALDALADSGDSRVIQFVKAYIEGSVYLWRGRPVVCREIVGDADNRRVGALHDALTGSPVKDADGQPAVVPEEDLKEVSPSRRERKAADDVIFALELVSPLPAKRLQAAIKSGDRRRIRVLPHLERALPNETNSKVRRAIRESISLIRLGGGGSDRQTQLQAVRELGELRCARAVSLLKQQLGADAELAGAAREAIDAIKSYQTFANSIKHTFFGLSLGSVLILMALGLSIIFGLMGVINMAHGELMMIGAYATYEVQLAFGYPESGLGVYFIVALPAAFLAAGIVGYLMEVLVIRHLYGRPLDSLLATWGIGLVLIQIVRLRYGNNIGVNSPAWLQGQAEIIQDVPLTYARLFILLLTGFCVVATYMLMNKTRAGLQIRATMQNRGMAASLGVNTRRVDRHTFAFGAGLAGIAGCALTLIGGVTPDMGQNYIVDSFLVVVTGGVGKLAGAVWAGLGLGCLNKYLDPYFGAVFGKVLILVAVVAFIQWKPSGLFAAKGRLADA